MHVIEIPTGRIGYYTVIRHVLANGRQFSPRNLETIDAGPTTVVIERPYDALPTGVGRLLNARIAAAEAVQLIGAFSDPELLPKQFNRFREDSGDFHGAYGTRVQRGNGQLYHIIRKLREDRDTRQAVVTLWDPALDNERDKRDYPCTVALGFRIVNDLLYANVLMRSNDVWLGFPYDVFQFTQLQLTIARVLGVGVGQYRHTVWSLHLYKHNITSALNVTPGKFQLPHKIDQRTGQVVTTPSLSFQPTGIGRPGDDDWAVIEERARFIPYASATEEAVKSLTTDELWYRDNLLVEMP